MNEREQEGLLKVALGLFGALLFCVLGYAARRKAVVVLACVVGGACSLLYAFTGFTEYQAAHYYGQRYGDPAIALRCKEHAIGPFIEMQRPCKVINGQGQE